MNMNKILLTVTLLVSAGIFAGEQPTGWLTTIDNGITSARTNVVGALSTAWQRTCDLVPSSVKTHAASFGKKISAHTPNCVTSGYGAFKTFCGNIADGIAKNTPEKVRQFVSNPNTKFVAACSVAVVTATVASVAAYKIARRIINKYACATPEVDESNKAKKTA